MRPFLAVVAAPRINNLRVINTLDSSTPAARLRRFVLYVAEFLASDDGAVIARLVTGIHDDTKLQRMFLERYVMPRRQMQAA